MKKPKVQPMIIGKDIFTNEPRKIKPRIVGWNIYVEWSDNPKLVRLDYELPDDLQQAIDDWFKEIENEEQHR